MKYFIIVLLIFSTLTSFAKENTSSKQLSKRKVTSDTNAIELTPAGSDYHVKGFGEGYVVNNGKIKGPKFLENGQVIWSLLNASDLNGDLQNWQAYDVDQLLIRTHFMKFQEVSALYPQLSSLKLKKLKQVLSHHEKK